MLLLSQWEKFVGLGSFVKAVGAANGKPRLEEDGLKKVMTDLIVEEVEVEGKILILPLRSDDFGRRFLTSLVFAETPMAY